MRSRHRRLNVNRILLWTFVTVLVLPYVSFAESWEEFQKIKSLDEQNMLVPKGNTRIIPKDIIIGGLKKNCEVTFASDALLFEYGSSTIRQDSLQTVKNMAAAIKEAMEDPGLSQIRAYYVDGHTCNIGSAENNCRLSWLRAEAITSELVKMGVPQERLKPRGFGPAYPAHPNDTEAARMLNRRVVLKGDCPMPTALDSQIPCNEQSRSAKSTLRSKNAFPELKPKAVPGQSFHGVLQ
jgi:outer membrane protein OmpA-like peptidoglycan-associated protein